MGEGTARDDVVDRYQEVEDSVRSSIGWTILTEVLVKVASPIAQLILVRLLTPGEFGVVAASAIITGLAGGLASSGMPLYIMRCKAADDQELHRYADSAFWTQLLFGLALWGVIIAFADPLAALVGIPGKGAVVIWSAATLPLMAFSSIHNAMAYRSFEFKRVMFVRVATSFVPLLVTVPLAFAGFSYWALIAGSIAGSVARAIGFNVVSKWHPGLRFSLEAHRRMLAFGFGAQVNTVVGWFGNWAAPMAAGVGLGAFELGMFRTTTSMARSLFSIVTAAASPVFTAGLSRLQDDPGEFAKLFLRFQFTLAVVVLPLSVGVFCYRDFATSLLLGPQWGDGALLLGLWGLSQGVVTVLCSQCLQALTTLGRLRASTMVLACYALVMAVASFTAVGFGFRAFVWAAFLARLSACLICQPVFRRVTGITTSRMLANLKEPLVATLVMGMFSYGAAWMAGGSWGFAIAGVIASAVLYTLVLRMFPRGRHVLRAMGAKVAERIAR